MPWTSSRSLRSSMVSYSSSAGASASISTWTLSMPTSSQSRCFIETYVSLAGSSLIRTVARPGVTPAASSVSTCAVTSSRTSAATDSPSMIVVASASPVFSVIPNPRATRYKSDAGSCRSQRIRGQLYTRFCRILCALRPESLLREQFLLALDRVDRVDLVRRQREVGGREVRAEVALARRLRDRHDRVLRGRPRDRDRLGRRVVRLRGRADGVYLAHSAAGQRRVRDDGVAVFAGVVQQFRVIEQRMELGLMGRQRRVEDLDGAVQLVRLEVRDADVPHDSLVDQSVEFGEGLVRVVRAPGTVDVQQVERLDAEQVGALTGC